MLFYTKMSLKDNNDIQVAFESLHIEEQKFNMQKALVKLIFGVLLVPLCFLVIWLVAFIFLGTIVKTLGVLGSYLPIISIVAAIGAFIAYAIISWKVNYVELSEFKKDMVSFDSLVSGESNKSEVGIFLKVTFFAIPFILHSGWKGVMDAKKNPPNQLWLNVVQLLYPISFAMDIDQISTSLQIPTEELEALFEERKEDVITTQPHSILKVNLTSKYREDLESSYS